MKARIILDGKKMAIKAVPKTSGELLKQLGISCEEAVVKLDGSVCPEGASLAKVKKIEVIRVVYGG